MCGVWGDDCVQCVCAGVGVDVGGVTVCVWCVGGPVAPGLSFLLMASSRRCFLERHPMQAFGLLCQYFATTPY